DVTQEQLKNRSWWSGPELFLVVDDYDLVVTQSGNPLQPIAPFLPQAKDVGLHLIVTRRVGGASRAMFDPVLGKLKELSMPGLLGHAPGDGGRLIGHLRPQPPTPGRGIRVTRKAGNRLSRVGWLGPE